MPGLDTLSPPSQPGAGMDRPPADHQVKTDDERMRIVLAGLDSNVDTFAREAAHEKLSQATEGPLWKKMVRSVWHSATHEYQAVSRTQQARQEILEQGNLLHHHGKSDKAWRAATVNRYASEYGEQLVRDGETFHRLNETADGNAQRIKADILGLVRQYAKGDIMDQASLEMAQERLVEAWRDEHVVQDYIGEGHFLAHNVGAMAEQVKAALDTEQGLTNLDRDAKLESLLANIDVVTGEAKVGSRAEIDATMSERLAAKLKDVPFIQEGRLAKVAAAVGNETTIAAMLSVAVYGAKRGMSAAVIVPGLGGGIIAALRERRALKNERVLEARRLDTGAEAAAPDGTRDTALRKLAQIAGIQRDSNQRRAEINETLYEARPVDELLDELGGLYNDTGELTMTDRVGLEQALKHFAEATARNQAYDRGRRLISFSGVDPEKMEDKRFDLDLALAKLETDLKRQFANPVAVAMMDIKPDESFQSLSEQQVSTMTGMLEGEMQRKDRLFAALVAKRSAQRAVMGTVLGTLIGGTVHEASDVAAHAAERAGHTLEELQQHAVRPVAFAQDGDQPPVPHSVGDASPSPADQSGIPAPETVGSDTPLDVPHSIGRETPVSIGDEVPYGNGEAHVLNETSKISVPAGYSVTAEGDSVTITGPDGHTFASLPLNRDGSLSSEALATLRSGGLDVADHVDIVHGEPQVTHPAVTPAEFVQNHRDDMVTVSHDKWFDNDTPRIDLNELQLRNSVDPDGNIIISVQGMGSEGSFHGTDKVDWREAAAQGYLHAYISASQGTQAHALKIPFGPDGRAIIAKDSPAAALFDAQGHFRGGFEESALSDGQSSDGVEHISTLATAVGDNQAEIADNLTETAPTSAHTYIVTGPESAVNPSVFTQSTTTPTITLTARRRLGGVAQQPFVVGSLSSGASTGQPPGSTAFLSGSGAPGTGAASAANGTRSAGGAVPPPPSFGKKDAGNPNAQPAADNDAERQFFAGLDSESLDTPPGYDFPGYARMGQRERKQSMRFISQAASELGGDDKVSVVARAMELAQAELKKATGAQAGLYRDTLDVLARSAERVRRDAEREAANDTKATDETLLKDLDAEAEPYQYALSLAGRGMDVFDPRSVKLATRIVRMAQGSVAPVPGEDGLKRKGRVVREALKVARASRSAEPGAQSLFDEAAQLLAQSMTRPAQEPRKNPWDNVS